MGAGKVALVQDWLTGFAGGEQVLLALHTMYPEAPIYTSLYNQLAVPQFDTATVIPSYLQRVPGLLKRDKLAIPLMPAAFESFDLKPYDTVISVGGGLAKGVITHPHQRHISYCHTPIRYIWNLGGDTRNKKQWDSWLRAPQEHKLRIWDVVSAQRVDQFIANSTTVQARIAKIYRMPSLVIHPPVPVERYQTASDTGEFYLTVGRLVQYKYTQIIIEACIALNRPLKVVGTGPDTERLKSIAGSSPLIEFLGHISDQERDQLYQRARAFILAAEEDFGIVPVEAMACGKPVIAYCRGGQTDVVIPGKTGVLFQVQTAEEVARAIEEFERQQFDPHAIHSHAEQFSNTIFEQKMRDIIEFQS